MYTCIHFQPVSGGPSFFRGHYIANPNFMNSYKGNPSKLAYIVYCFIPQKLGPI